MSAKAKSKLTPEQQKATMTRVLQKIKPYGFFVVCSLIVAAVSVAAQLYIPILCGSAIDMMLGKGTVDFAGVLRIIYEIIVVAVVAAFAQWLLSVCNNRITFAVSRDLRNAAMRKIQTLPLSYLDSHPSGDIVSRMVADVDTFADGLLMGFTQLFSGVLTILGTLLFMLQQNIPITLVVVCITPLSLVVASFLAKRSYKYFQSQSTVRENIAYGKPDASLDEVVAAAKAAHADSFIRRLPEGYDTVIAEDGGNISQGQKQLLCIARVMLCLPPMLILDEATSSIDTRTEVRIQAAFARMMQGRTSFIVAHRLSTIREADVILVMKDGHIVEQGDHDTLLAQGGFYAKLYNSQFEGVET